MGNSETKSKGDGDDSSNISDQLHLLKSGDQSDVILKCCGQSFNVHSHILAARSDVFRSLIGDLDEKRELHTEDVSPIAIETMLHYMYSGEVPDMSIESTMKVYQAAETYGMHTLKNKCRSAIEKKLNEANVCSVLSFSDKVKCIYLKNVVITYLIDRKSFLQSEIWRGFCDEYPKLVNEVHLAFIRNIK